jgi:two-component system cell cycle response regulator CtrA
MTACIIHSANIVVERASFVTAMAADFAAEVVDAPWDFGSRLFREADAIGILWASDGFSGARTVKEFRKADINNRLIVLIGETGDLTQDAVHRSRTLIAGADDVQPDTIQAIELMARLKAVAERGAYLDHLAVKLPGGCTFFMGRGVIESPRGDVRLAPNECAMLQELARKAGQTLSKSDLMDALYPGEDVPDQKVIDVYVCKIRRKITEATGGLDCVQTIWGRGYTFVPDGFEVQRDQYRTRGVLRRRQLV